MHKYFITSSCQEIKLNYLRAFFQELHIQTRRIKLHSSYPFFSFKLKGLKVKQQWKTGDLVWVSPKNIIQWVLNSIKQCRNNTVRLASSEEDTSPAFQSYSTSWSWRNKFWLLQNLMMTETTSLETTSCYRQKPTTKSKGDWRQTSTGGLISNSTEHMQLPLIWSGIQHLKKRRGLFCVTEPWPVDEYLQAVPAVVWRRQELHPDKTGTRRYFVNGGSLKLPEHWMTHIWIGLCIYFLQYCIKKFSDRAPLVSFARKGQGCRATILGQQVLQSFPQTLHVPTFPP